jgi:hypothetical protein
MNLFKSLFLGSAATLVAVAGAQAADLPMAEPVEYVKVCDTYGNNFFYLPGSETCLRIGGSVRVEAIYVEPRTNDDTKVEFHARARLIADARTATEYGLLRSYFRYQFDRDTNGSSGGSFDYALIQFAGLTVGYTDSFFDFKPYSSYAGMLVSDIQTLLFAYTAEFGDGFSGTISAEDRTYREYTSGMVTPAGGVPRGDPFNYAGQSMPDFVANLRVEQGWGSAQISAAVHQVDPAYNGLRKADTEYGWAVQGGVQINLPMIAEDDFIYASGAYAEGALSYLISGAGVGRDGNNDYLNGVPTSDFIYGNRPGTKVELTKGFNVNGGFSHNWSPNWKSSVDASYADITYAHNVRGFNPDWALVTVAAQTVWSPVSNLDIGVEVVYSRFTERPEGLRTGWNGTPGGAAPDNWAGRVRVERTF